MLLFFLKSRIFGSGQPKGVIWREAAHRKKKKKKDPFEAFDNVNFGRSEVLELMDDDFNRKVKSILLTLLMEDDD